MNMTLQFEVIRHRMSVTQGEAEVLVNGKSIVRYGDQIILSGPFYRIGDWGSKYDDNVFIKAAIKQYTDKIISEIPELTSQ